MEAEKPIFDSCEVDRYLPIHQLNKLNEKGNDRFDFFPLTVVQAVFDKTGVRLDTILSSYNYIFLPWAGSREATRLQVKGLMRRKSLVICYRDVDDTIIIETHIGNKRNDEDWPKDENWKGFVDWLRDVIIEILGNLDQYPEIYQALMDFLADFKQQIVDDYTRLIKEERERAEAAEATKMPKNVQFKAKGLPAGSNPTVEYDDAGNSITFGIPKGDKGDQGEKGEQGEQGEKGDDGADGSDGSDAEVDTSQFATKEELESLREQIEGLETGGEVTVSLETLTFNEEGDATQTYNGTQAVTVDLDKYCTEDEVNALIQKAGVSGGEGGGSDLPLPNLTFNEEDGVTQKYDGTAEITVDLEKYATDAELQSLKSRVDQLSSGSGSGGGTSLPLATLSFSKDGAVQETYDGTEEVTVTADTLGALTKAQADTYYLTEDEANNLYLSKSEVGDYLTEEKANNLYVSKTEAEGYVKKSEYDTKVQELTKQITDLTSQVEELKADLEEFVRSNSVHTISVENGSAGDGDLKLIFDNV